MEESCLRTLEIEVPEEVVRKKLLAVTSQYQKHARLPGFRPGKAPLAIVRKRYEEDIRSQVLQELVPGYVEAGVKEHKWEPVGTPSVTEVQFSDDAPLRFKAVLEVLPDFELQDLSGLKVKVAQAEVAEEEVDEALTRLQSEAATYTNVDPRPLQDGDFASISVKGISPGNANPDVELEEVLCEIGGPDTVTEFNENLRGTDIGDVRNFDVAYPDDYRDNRLAGRTVSYQVQVAGIKQKQVPDLDDEFAREVGPFDSLDALKARIREDMEKARQREAEEEARRDVRKQMVQLHDFPAPESLVEQQVERRMDRLRRHLASQGLDPKSLSIDWGEARTAQRQDAEEEVKSSLILEKIADQQDIEVEEAEVEAEIEQIAASMGQQAEAIRARLTSPEATDRIKSRLRMDKALGFVLQGARG